MNATNIKQNNIPFEVCGDSMEPVFREGDIIFVDPGLDANSGDYVIAKNGDEATFKQFVVDGPKMLLKPLNNRHPTKEIAGETRIWGVVVKMERLYCHR